MVRSQMFKSMITRVAGGEVVVQIEAFQEEVVVEHLCSKSKVPILSLGPWMLNFASVAITRTNGRGSAIVTPSVPTGPRANRPLDPAIDPNREYGYKTKRGGRAFTMSYSDGKAAPVDRTLGRGQTPNDARATMVGSTVRVAPASRSKGTSEYSEPPRAPRKYGIALFHCTFS
jgi:hypothetical protein